MAYRIFNSLVLISILTGCSMIILPEKFEIENNKGENTPAVIVEIEESVLNAEESTQADWTANTGESNVDYATMPGDVILGERGLVENFETGGDTWRGDGFAPNKAQGFKVNADLTTSKFSVYIRTEFDFVDVVRGYIYADDSGKPGSIIATSTSDVAVNAAGWYDFTITANLTASTQYYVGIDIVSGSQILQWWVKDIGNPYADGGFFGNLFPWAAWGVNSDGYFRIYATFFDSGYIITDEMDLGSTPTNDGEWVLSDLTPDDSAITFEAWSSATGAFGGEEASLGTIIDGDDITDWKRYYKVKATLSANSSQDESPTLESIKADFASYAKYATAPVFGYEPIVKTIGSISTTIDDFKSSTISQMTLTMGFSESLSTFLSNNYPKNKLIKIQIGFLADGWLETDYIDFFWGQIDNWSITARDTISITTKDFQKEWSVDLPAKWESAGDDITWTAQHHCDVMLDILQNQINVRDSKIESDSFGVVKASLSGWEVTRTITGDSEDGKGLMEELRVLTSTYFIPQANGSIKLKKWDSSEAAVETLTDTDFESKTWDANAKSLINRSDIYYDWDGSGTKSSDFGSFELGTDATSQSNWGETKSKTIKDKWTDATETAQIQTLEANILARYADAPAIMNVTLDMRKMYLEVGDMVNITTVRAPSSDMTGITGVKFQIVNRNLDFLKHTLKLKLLAV